MTYAEFMAQNPDAVVIGGADLDHDMEYHEPSGWEVCQRCGYDENEMDEVCNRSEYSESGVADFEDYVEVSPGVAKWRTSDDPAIETAPGVFSTGEPPTTIEQAIAQQSLRLQEAQRQESVGELAYHMVKGQDGRLNGLREAQRISRLHPNEVVKENPVSHSLREFMAAVQPKVEIMEFFIFEMNDSFVVLDTDPNDNLFNHGQRESCDDWVYTGKHPDLQNAINSALNMNTMRSQQRRENSKAGMEGERAFAFPGEDVDDSVGWPRPRLDYLASITQESVLDEELPSHFHVEGELEGEEYLGLAVPSGFAFANLEYIAKMHQMGEQRLGTYSTIVQANVSSDYKHSRVQLKRCDRPKCATGFNGEMWSIYG